MKRRNLTDEAQTSVITRGTTLLQAEMTTAYGDPVTLKLPCGELDP